jgi:tetratricopeptide (TPR) repeat protein
LERDIRVFTKTSSLLDDEKRRETLGQLLERAKALGTPAQLSSLLSIASNEAGNALDQVNAVRATTQSILLAEMAHDAETTWNVLAEALYVFGYMFESQQDPDEILRLAQAHLARSGGEALASARLCVAASPYLSMRGRNDEAEQCLRAAVERFERELGPRHPETVHAISVLAFILIWQQSYGEAESLYLKVRAAYEDLVSPRHSLLASANYNLAAIKAMAGDGPRALEYIDRAKVALLDDTSDVALALVVFYNAGIMASDQGHLARAKNDYQFCEAIARQGPEEMRVAPRWACHVGLAKVRAQTGDDAACSNLDESFEHLKASPISGYFGEEMRLESLARLRDVAWLCADSSFATKVQATIDRNVSKGLRGIVVPNGVETAAEFFSAKLYRESHDESETAAMLQRLLASRPRLDLDQGHTVTLNLRLELVESLLTLGQSENALRMLDEDEDVRQRNFGVEFDSIAAAAILRAWAWMDMQRTDEALETLTPLVASLAASEQNLLLRAYALTLMAQAKIMLGSSRADADQTLKRARFEISKLRVVPRALKQLMLRNPTIESTRHTVDAPDRMRRKFRR